MKPLALALLLVVAPVLRAQTNAVSPAPPAAGGGVERAALSILTPAQQMEYAQAHEKALAGDPALKKEGDRLKQQFAQVMTNGTPAEKQALIEKVDAHRMKLRQAMLKTDPNLGPVFAQIDRYISESKAKGTAR